ncbi:MAG TPA: glycosyltransferase [Blastocatellia bacterium]|nr:glycosyltransferase [Blastocatellia bacterium]
MPADSISGADHQTPVSCPLVSVLVTVYNQGQYVRECLVSIVNNSYPNLEIIIVDDASQDDSDTVIRDWIRDYSDEDVIYLRHERNVGLASSLNEAIRAAHGGILCLIAGDDLLLPNGIADRVDYLIQNPDKLLVFADCHVINESGRQIHESAIEGLYRKFGMRKALLAIDELIPFSIFHHWAICGPMTMCRSEAFAVAGPYDDRLMVDDWDLYLRVAVAGKVGFCDRYVGKYRLHHGNTIVTHRQRVLDDCIRISRRYAHHFPGVPGLRTTMLRAYWQYNESKSSPGRAFYYLVTGLLWALSTCICKSIETVLVLKYKYRRENGRAASA